MKIFIPYGKKYLILKNMYNWPQRKNQRLKNFDYSQNGFYFVTICTKNRENYFGEIVDGKMILNEYGKIAEQNWKNILNHYQNVDIDEFVVMPNHIHGIILSVGNEYFRSYDENRSDNWNENQINGNENIHSLPNLSNIIKWFKIWCTKEIRNIYNDFTFTWQKSFFDVIIRNDEQLEKIRQYIIDNPIKWEWDANNPLNIKK